MFSSWVWSCLHSYLDIGRYFLIYLDIRISPCRAPCVCSVGAPGRYWVLQCCSGQRAAAAAELQRGGEQPALYIVITTTTPTAPAPHQPTTPPQPTSQTAVARVINSWHQCSFTYRRRWHPLMPSSCRKHLCANTFTFQESIKTLSYHIWAYKQHGLSIWNWDTCLQKSSLIGTLTTTPPVSEDLQTSTNY